MPVRHKVGVVAVTDTKTLSALRRRIYAQAAALLVLSAIAALLLAVPLQAAELPAERSEVMYHSYDGGGVQVDGPAVLVRKGLGDSLSVAASYYVDSVSSASIDVLTNASPYREERTEAGLSLDYLHRDTLVSASFSTSDESDYEADTFGLSVAQEFFGGLSTLQLGFTLGDDVVGRADNNFRDTIERRQYRVGFSQVLSKRMVANISYEAISDEGYLNNPYRSARLLGASVPEVYPRTRTSNTVALRAIRYWPARVATRAEYRYFEDTWQINAHSFELGASRYFGDQWLLDAFVRFYNQDRASFYADNFDQPQNYMARDKELSTFASKSAGARLSYTLFENPESTFERGTLNLGYEFINFDYDDFTDSRNGELYGFDSHVLQLYFSVWY